MKKLLAVLGLVVILVLALAAPVSAESNFTTIKYQLGTGTQVYDLGLGNGYTQVGTVTVSVDATQITVKYDTNSGYYLTATHLAVASGADYAAAIAKIPNQPGKFNKTPWPSGYYGALTDPMANLTTFSYSVPLSYFPGIGNNGWVLIAAHAGICGTQTGTAWANGLGHPPSQPLPELPAGLLLGAGLAAIGAIIFIRKQPALTTK
jgi:hypothetical protein